MSDFGNFIKSAGVGGGGVNALEFLRGAMRGGKCLAIDTDAKTLEASGAEEKILIGKSITRSMSAGGDMKVGVSYRNVMSVRVPEYDFPEPRSELSYGFATSPGSLDVALDKFLKLLPSLVRLAAEEKAVSSMALEKIPISTLVTSRPAKAARAIMQM